MTDEEIAVKFEGHVHEIASLKHRLKEVEEMTESINKLAISVEKLALSVDTMLSRQASYEARLKAQGERIGLLERAPDKADAEKWKQVVKIIITATITGLIGAAMGKFL